MGERIQTSTPIMYEKFVLPPPRKLWAADSPAEQLYFNKWKKYRNSIVDDNKKSWGDIDAPNFVDFQDIPDIHDNYFDNVDNENLATPQRFNVHQWSDGFNEENNNLLEGLKQCTLSTIKKSTRNRRDGTDDSNRSLEAIDPISIVFGSLEKSTLTTTEKSDGNRKNEVRDPSSTIFESLEKTISTTIEKSNENGKNEIVDPNPIIFGSLKKSILTNSEKLSEGMITEATELPDQPVLKNNVEKPLAIKSKIDKKICTIVEPFSFEIREKCIQEHKQARRERDSIGNEPWKGFRANPCPNFLKSRAKIVPTVKTSSEMKEATNSLDKCKVHNAAEIWKKKAFQLVYPKRVPVVPKAPELLTAARAKSRQRFKEQMREKERQRLAFQQIEEAERKKREEEEIAKLRKDLVHKAQPIRKYKMFVPKVGKRPLAEPTIPIKCKRPRKV